MGEWRYSSPIFMTWALDGGQWSDSQVGRFTDGEAVPGILWAEGWVAPKNALGKTEISCPEQETNPALQPVVSRCAN